MMVSQTPKEFTKDDFLFVAVENPEKDPESLFSDEEFVIKQFEILKSKRKKKR